MVKSNYWEKREREWIEKNIHADADMDKLLETKFDELETSLYKDVQGFYVNYAKSQNITMAEAKKKVASFDVKAFEKEAKKLVEAKDFSKEANERLKLYNATMRINRQQALAAKVGLSAASVMNDTEGIIRDKLENDILNEHKHQAGLLGMTIPERIDLRGQALIDGSYQGAKWSERLWTNSDAMVSDVTNIINRSLIQGMNPNQLASKLRPYLNKSVSNAKYVAQRLARTESARISTEYKQLLYKDQGYELGKWIAESSACKICLPKDGKVFKLDDINVPRHPNCRCSFVPYFEYKHSKIGSDQDDNQDSEDFHSDNMTKTFGPANAKKFEDIINSKGFNPKIKQVFKKYQDNFKFQRIQKSQTNCYSGLSERVQLNDYAWEGSVYQNPTEVAFHEMGHAFDHMATEELFGKEGASTGKTIKAYGLNVKQYSATASGSEKYGFDKAIQSDVKDLEKRVKKENGFSSIYETRSKIVDDFKAQRETMDIIDWQKKYSTISDMLESEGHYGKYPLGFGHGTSYWKSGGTQATEFVAEMTESIAANPESLKVFEKYLPNAVKVYWKFIDDINKGEFK